MTPELRDSYKIDKTGWGEGPWNSEPDRLDFHHAGFPCLALRNHSGNWCGYVGLPAAHVYYRKDYGSLDLDVHGGLTYAGECSGHICHVAEEGTDDMVWWLGFDCGHYCDYAPGIAKHFRSHGLPGNIFDRGDYKTLEYVRGEIENLAVQLSQVK